ncbi:MULTISPECIES: hypothetical protein [unclassified Mesorhizobium]|uniref:hypothetical protein n=1 Tax=unclassified Mesorhizobium TaxID=325217 RepID=UPI001FDA0500|nr:MULTISPECIES: hypothetical protein [unclassified Mesorhizobium]WJI64035.1 hypothetical protein NLY43_04515 [Mesorhizobium sp. C416B]
MQRNFCKWARRQSLILANLLLRLPDNIRRWNRGRIMTSATFARPEKFQIGRVFNNSFSVIGRNVVLFVGLSVLFAGVPAVILRLWTESRMQALLTANPGAAADPALVFSNIWVTLPASFIASLFVLVLQSALVRATIEDLNGKRPTLGDCLQIAIRYFLPTLAIGLLVGLGAGLAALALLVPGIILWLGWSVAIPVQIQERLGVFGSMSRSRALTKGSRWSLFGLFLVLIIIGMVIQGAVGVFVYLFHDIVATVVAALVQSVMSMLLSVAAAVSYVELRQVREGTSIDELAEIFS